MLQIASDRRSEKVAQLQESPQAAICWYFSKTREQFRISGAVVVVDGETEWVELGGDRVDGQKVRQVLWEQLSVAAKVQWFWPQPKGDRGAETVFVDELPVGAEAAPAEFVVLLVLPEEVDHLQLRGEPQFRHVYRLEAGEWSDRWVNP